MSLMEILVIMQTAANIELTKEIILHTTLAIKRWGVFPSPLFLYVGTDGYNVMPDNRLIIYISYVIYHYQWHITIANWVYFLI
jgi:hypothetical protein